MVNLSVKFKFRLQRPGSSVTAQTFASNKARTFTKHHSCLLCSRIRWNSFSFIMGTLEKLEKHSTDGDIIRKTLLIGIFSTFNSRQQRKLVVCTSWETTEVVCGRWRNLKDAKRLHDRSNAFFVRRTITSSVPSSKFAQRKQKTFERWKEWKTLLWLWQNDYDKHTRASFPHTNRSGEKRALEHLLGNRFPVARFFFPAIHWSLKSSEEVWQ